MQTPPHTQRLGMRQGKVHLRHSNVTAHTLAIPTTSNTHNRSKGVLEACAGLVIPATTMPHTLDTLSNHPSHMLNSREDSTCPFSPHQSPRITAATSPSQNKTLTWCDDVHLAGDWGIDGDGESALCGSKNKSKHVRLATMTQWAISDLPSHTGRRQERVQPRQIISSAG